MEENHDEQHFTERELAGSHASATRRDQLFPLAIFEDLCKIIDTAIQGGDRHVHEGGILSVGFGTDTKSGSARFWNTHQPAYPELGLSDRVCKVSEPEPRSIQSAESRSLCSGTPNSVCRSKTSGPDGAAPPLRSRAVFVPAKWLFGSSAGAPLQTNENNLEMHQRVRAQVSLTQKLGSLVSANSPLDYSCFRQLPR